MIPLLCGIELHGLRPTAGGAGELATCPAGAVWLPRELAAAPDAAQEPLHDDVGPTRDHETASPRRDVLTTGGRLAVEVVRTCFTEPLEARLQRVVTTLVATPLTNGVPAGAPIDVSALTDPFSNPLPHPGGAALDLFVRWYLVWSQDRGVIDAPGLITTIEEQIPRGVGIVGRFESWADFRYAWQSRYSDEQNSASLPEGFAQLFAVLVAPADAWRCRVGGLINLRLSRKRPRRDMPPIAVR